MLATSARSVPDIAFASVLSFRVLHTSWSPSRSIVTWPLKRWVIVPSGPFTEISFAAMVTSTLGGTGMGNLPIRDMLLSPLRHDAEHFAADPGGARLAIGHHAARGGHD